MTYLMNIYFLTDIFWVLKLQCQAANTILLSLGILLVKNKKLFGLISRRKSKRIWHCVIQEKLNSVNYMKFQIR
jgi:hypothetical protein